MQDFSVVRLHARSFGINFLISRVENRCSFMSRRRACVRSIRWRSIRACRRGLSGNVRAIRSLLSCVRWARGRADNPPGILARDPRHTEYILMERVSGDRKFSSSNRLFMSWYASMFIYISIREIRDKRVPWSATQSIFASVNFVGLWFGLHLSPRDF